MPNQNDVLLALTALQMNFINKDQVIEALLVSSGLKDKPVAEIFRERDYLNSRQLELLTGLVDERLALSDNDPVKTLHSMGISAELHASLISLGNADISKTLSEITPNEEPKVRTVIITRGTGGKYTIKHEHARGGIGRIMVAADNDIDREVAMKILISDGFGSGTTETKEISDRFMEEAKITGQLEHPNIVPVYEIGTTEVEEGSESLYYTMKFIRGKTLSKKIKAYHKAKGVEPLTPLLDAFKDVCHAISFAHSKGVIHRDLKPENVMVGDYGETLVLDWGLAKTSGHEDTRGNMLRSQILMFQDESRQKTMEGFVLGTPAYMPPEQARGNVKEIDERSDIYSLGAILYEILTGKPPFDGANAYEVLGKVINDEPVKPSEAVSSKQVPMELEAICMKCMSKSKKTRYRSPSEIVADIESYQEGRSGEAWSYSTAQVVKLWISRNKLLAAACAAAIVFLVLGAAISLNFGVAAKKSEKKALTAEQVAEQQKEAAVVEKVRAKAAEKDALAQKKIAENERSVAIAREKEAMHNMSLLCLSMGDKAMLDKRYGEALHYYAASLEAEENQTARDTVTAAKVMVHSQLKWSYSSRISSPVVAAGEKILIMGNPCCLIDIKTGKETSSPLFLVKSQFLILSPEGKTVFKWTKEGIERWDIESGKLTGTIPLGRFAYLRFMEISPSGEYLVFPAKHDDKQYIVVYDSVSLKEISATPVDHEYIRRLMFSGDGQTLFSCDGDGNVTVWDFTSPKDIRIRTVIKTSEDRIAISEISSDSKGKRIATGSKDGTLKLWNTATGELYRSMTSMRYTFYEGLIVFPDGERIAWVDDLSGGLVIEDFESGIRFESFDGEEDGIFLTPDGRYLTTIYLESGDTVKMKAWEVHSYYPSLFLDGEGSFGPPTSSSDGEAFVVSCDARIIFWDFETRSKKEWAIPPRKVSGLTITTDKKQVVFALQTEGMKTYTIVFLDIVTGNISDEIRTEYELSKHPLVTTEDGRFVVANFGYWAQKDGKRARGYGIRAWDIASKKEIPRLCEIGDEYGCHSLIPGGNTVLLGGKDGSILIWDLETDKSIGEIPSMGSEVKELISSPDGNKCLAFLENNAAIVWDVKKREFHLSLPERKYSWDTHLQGFTSDSKKIILYISEEESEIWDIEKKKLIRTISVFRASSKRELFFGFFQLSGKLWVMTGSVGEGFMLRQLRIDIDELDFNIPVSELKRNAERITGMRLTKSLEFKEIPAEEYNRLYGNKKKE